MFYECELQNLLAFAVQKVHRPMSLMGERQMGRMQMKLINFQLNWQTDRERGERRSHWPGKGQRQTIQLRN